jgi:hypothetical protein
MLRLINIIAGLSLSFSAFASGPVYHHVKEEAVLQDVAVEPTNGGFNPDFRAYIIRGQVMVASNSCFAQGLQAKLRLEKAADGNTHAVAYVEGRQRSDLICIQIFQPVYADVSVTVRGEANLVETVFIRNVDEMGTLRPLADFTDYDAGEEAANRCEQQAICTREYRPTLCTVDGQEIRGSNRCVALVNVKRFACLNGITFREEDVSCRYSHFAE